MPIGTTLTNRTLPTDGTADWGDSALSPVIQGLIDAVEANVPSSAVTWAATVDLDGCGVQGVDYITFDAQSAHPSASNSLWMYSDDEVYLRDGAGNLIQATSGGSMNTGVASNGITGSGYGSSGVAVDWSSADSNYRFFSAASTYCGIVASTVGMRSGSYEATLDAPTLAADVTFTLPAAAPGTSGTILQSDTSGNWSLSNTVNSLTTTNAITAGTGLTVTTGGATITAGGVGVTAGGITVTAGDVTIPEADVIHGSRSKFISPAWLYNNYLFSDTAASSYTSFITSSGITYFQFTGSGAGSSTDRLYFPIGTFLEIGQRLLSVKIYTAGTWAGDAGFDVFDAINGTTIYSGGSIPSGTTNSSVTASSLNHPVTPGDITLVIDIDSDATRQIRGIELAFDRTAT